MNLFDDGFMRGVWERSSGRHIPNTMSFDVKTTTTTTAIPPEYLGEGQPRNLVTDDYVIIDYYATNMKEGECMLNKKHYEVDRVIINDPATIIIWKDKTKTVVKCGENDEFNPEAGIALAYMKRVMFEDKTTQFNKWMNKQTKGYYDSICNSCLDRLREMLNKDKK